MLEVVNFIPKSSFWLKNCKTKMLINEINKNLGLSLDEYYLLINGKRLNTHDDDELISDSKIYISPRIIGGKGGFGSMLRAIGAQIEKTTNREACRDLSGRRLRDINEEKRLKNWIDQQAEREKDAADKKKKKLERLCQKPKHEFKDACYDKERFALPEKVEDALSQGLQASAGSSGGGNKRKLDTDKAVTTKRARLWMDEDIELSDDDDNDQSSEEETVKVGAVKASNN